MTTLPGFSVVDFNSCTRKAICGCESDNPGYVYNSFNPCANAIAYDFDASACTCQIKTCRKYYLEVYMSDNYCTNAAGDGILSDTSGGFLQATIPTIGPANSLKCSGASAPKGAQGGFTKLVDCSGNSINGIEGMTALALGQGGRQYAGHRLWEVDDGNNNYDNPVLVDSYERNAGISPLPTPGQPGLPTV